MSSTTGPAKVLAAALVLGAILAAFVASGIGLKQPFRIDEPADLTIAYAVLGAWLVVYLVLAIVGVLIVGSSLATLWLASVAIFYFLDLRADVFAYGILYLTLASPAEFALLVLVPVVPLVTFRTAVRLFLADDLDVLRGSARTVKLALIPLFVQNFVLCTIVVLGLTLLPVVITRGAILLSGPAGVVLVGATASTGLIPTVIGTYLMMLPTSIYGVTCLALMLRHRAITPRFCALHMVLQFVFVADIISTLVIAQRARQVLRAPLVRTVVG